MEIVEQEKAIIYTPETKESYSEVKALLNDVTSRANNQERENHTENANRIGLINDLELEDDAKNSEKGIKQSEKFEAIYTKESATETEISPSYNSNKSNCQNEMLLSNESSNENNKIDEELKLKAKTRKNRKRIFINESDSDNETDGILEEIKSDTEINTDQSSLRTKLALLYSDDEEYEKSNKQNRDKSISKHTNKYNHMLSGSDSEIEENVTSHNKSFSDINLNESTSQVTETSKWSSLCDPDSSEDESQEVQETIQTHPPYEENSPNQKKYQKKSKAKNSDEDQPKKMTAKEAAEQMKEILSESQRRIREKNISLPYHKPKTHNIKEFLLRRPKLASAVQSIQLPTGAPPSLAIKMPREQLEIVYKKMKEREGKLKEFYKSESESEDENDETYVPPEEEPKSPQPTNDEVTDEANKQTNEKIYAEDIGHQDNLCNMEKVEISDCKHVSSEGIKSSSEDATDTRNQFLEDENFLSSDVQKENKKVSEEDKLGRYEKVSNIELENEAHNDRARQDQNRIDEKQIRDCFSIDSLMESEINDEYKNAIEGKQNGTESYDFNLDDMEQSEPIVINSTKNLNPDIIETQFTKPNDTDKFNFTDLDREIESFGETNVEDIEIPKKLSKLDLIKDRLNNMQPRLSGGPDEIIELDSGVTKPNEITKLMERFVQHTSKKHQHKHKVQLSVVTVENGGDIHKETVAMNVDDEDTAVEEKPGARLQRLREELQIQMAQRKSELWQQKSKNGISGSKAEGTVDEDNEKEGYEDAYDDILDDENEEEMTDDDSDELEDDVELQDKPMKKFAFVDDEAEEEDGEFNENDDINEPGSDADEEENGKQERHENEQDQVDSEESEPESKDKSKTLLLEGEPGKKKLKRIVNTFDDDSDDEDADTSLKNILFSKINQVAHVPESQDDIILPHQKKSDSPVRQTTQFLTPVSYITGIQNLTSTSKKHSPGNPLGMCGEPSPLKENNWSSNLQKKLFMDNIPDSQELAEFCAGKFAYTQELSQVEPGKSNAITSVEQKVPESEPLEIDEIIGESEQEPSTQDLLNLCSGNFTGVTQVPEVVNTIADKPTQVIELNEITEIKSLGEDQDLLISQLIDEEEMESFKKKFDSPEKLDVEEPKEIIGGGIVDSDDEDYGNGLAVKKKNQRKLQFSDDEETEESDREEDNDEEIDLQDEVDDDVSVENIGYDSEENEYEVISNVEESNSKPEKVKLTDFFEAEAELSESEWGSADEDEKDLDNFELEEGDKEKFDNNKIRTEIEKIHMRKVLDDDIREVRMLQELLLEDGEMHGTGRQRQFKWKNIDSIDDGNEENRPADDEIYLDEEESEEQWRKRRHEREMFLKEKLRKNQEEGEDMLTESQLLKLGKKVLERSQGSGSQPNTPPVNESEKEVEVKQPFSLLTKRGSFLTRKDRVLERIAEYTKVVATVNVGTAKNSKKFIFQSVSNEAITEVKKRKAANADGTPVAIKRLRLSELSPALKKKSEKSDRVKKLFSN